MHNTIKDIILRIIGNNSPKFLARLLFYKVHHYWPSFANPQNLDEKINWLKFNTDTRIWSILTDKYLVREFITKKGLSCTLNDIYGVYDNAEDINIDTLPNSFVIKTTNGSSGMQVLIVDDKSTINWNETIAKLNKWLYYSPPFTLAEPHYARIKPRIIIEKLLKIVGQNSLIDYKFHCFNGEVISCLVCSNRVNGKAIKSIYDLNWEIHPENVVTSFRNAPLIAKPKSLDRMIEYSKVLSKGFPYVRVDWYEIDDKPIFSELTFTPAGGYNKTMTSNYILELGKYLTLPKLDK